MDETIDRKRRLREPGAGRPEGHDPKGGGKKDKGGSKNKKDGNEGRHRVKSRKFLKLKEPLQFLLDCFER